MHTRIPFVVAFAFSVLWGPFWLSVILFLIGVVVYDYFLEGSLLMFIVDILYGVPLDRFYGYPLVSFSVGILLMLLAEYIKKKSRFKRFNEK